LSWVLACALIRLQLAAFVAPPLRLSTRGSHWLALTTILLAGSIIASVTLFGHPILLGHILAFAVLMIAVIFTTLVGLDLPFGDFQLRSFSRLSVNMDRGIADIVEFSWMTSLLLTFMFLFTAVALLVAFVPPLLAGLSGTWLLITIATWLGSVP